MPIDDRDQPQPPLPFEPPVSLVPASANADATREVSLDALSALLLQEFHRRAASVSERDDRRAARRR